LFKIEEVYVVRLKGAEEITSDKMNNAEDFSLARNKHLRSLELRISTFAVAKIIIKQQRATRIATHSSVVPVRDLVMLRNCAFSHYWR
jgi:hypothetical protein